MDENEAKLNEKEAKIVEKVVAKYEAEELPYRRISFYAYIFVLVVIGLPVWYYTTTPYRASLEDFPADMKFHLPLHIRMYYAEQKVEPVLKQLVEAWKKENLPFSSSESPLELSYEFELVYRENLVGLVKEPRSSECYVELVFLDGKEFEKLKPEEGAKVLISHGRYIMPSPTDPKLLEAYLADTKSVINEEVIDINRLSMILQRERRGDHEKSQRTLNPEVAVWEDVSIAPKYNVHVVFIHDEPNKQPRSRPLEEQILKNIERLANLVGESTHLSLSWEHFWDFSLENFVKAEKRMVLPFGSISDFVTEVDRYSAAIAEPNPTFKLAVIFSEKDVRMVDEENNPANSIAVASWGGIISTCITCKNSTNTSAASLDVLRTLLGLRKRLPENLSRLSDSIQDLAWERFRIHVYVENLLRAKHYVHAINELTAKIADLVVSDEVAKLVRDSIEGVKQADGKARNGGCLDPFSASKARVLAERAVNHPSLLEYLNFPWQQKYAIYLPLFFPVLLPVMEGLKEHFYAWKRRRQAATQ